MTFTLLLSLLVALPCSGIDMSLPRLLRPRALRFDLHDEQKCSFEHRAHAAHSDGPVHVLEIGVHLDADRPGMMLGRPSVAPLLLCYDRQRCASVDLWDRSRVSAESCGR